MYSVLVFVKTILVSSTGKVNLDLVPGFEIVLVLRMLILEQGEGVPELLSLFLKLLSACSQPERA